MFELLTQEKEIKLFIVADGKRRLQTRAFQARFAEVHRQQIINLEKIHIALENNATIVQR